MKRTLIFLALFPLMLQGQVQNTHLAEKLLIEVKSGEYALPDTVMTSGTLETGQWYRIGNFVTGDNFSNVGAENLSGYLFQATGTTPTTWTNQSLLRKQNKYGLNVPIQQYKFENRGAVNMGNDFWMFQGTDYLQATAHTLIGDITFSCEFVAEDCTNKQYIYSNTKFEVYIEGEVLKTTSNGSTLAISDTLTDDSHYSVIIVRAYDGETNIYLNGVISGVANQATGTPASGTTHTIGQDFYGLIGSVRVNQLLFDSGEIALMADLHSYTNWKELYYAYGVEWDIRRSSPSVLRVGYLPLHASLPIQSNMKGCVLEDDGDVAYYLHDDNWAFQTDSATASKLDGTDGQVMVEVPEYWYKFTKEGYIQRMMISAVEVPGYRHVPKTYMGAYKAALSRSTSKLASVVSMATDYRGGNNNATWDGTDRTLLGKPATSLSRTNFRTYAKNRGTGWYQKSFQDHGTLLWLFVIEYGTRNGQAAVNATLTAEGYHQGGLGVGVTNLVSAEWNTYNTRYPVLPCGKSDSLGNFSGEVDYTIPGYTGTNQVKVNRYRGIETPFGHLNEWVDGVNYYHQTTAEGGKSLIYLIEDPADFVDVIDANNVLVSNKITRSSGYAKTIIGSDYGLWVSSDNSGSGTTYWVDQTYSDASTYPGLRALHVGGFASIGSVAGFGSMHSHNAASVTSARLGSRLCFRVP